MAVSTTMPILIVDDYNTMIRILRNLLRQLGFTNIDEASDGRTALAKLRAKDYALVISDWTMAPMSGEELLAELRADVSLRDTPFMVVAVEGEIDAETAKARGANGCFSKPLKAQDIRVALAAISIECGVAQSASL